VSTDGCVIIVNKLYPQSQDKIKFTAGLVDWQVSRNLELVVQVADVNCISGTIEADLRWVGTCRRSDPLIP